MSDLSNLKEKEEATTPVSQPGDEYLPNLLEWAYSYRRIDEQPFTLEYHKPLVQIYNDEHPFIAIIKSAQKGLSEYAITRAAWMLDVGARYFKTGKAGLNIGYLFPTQTALSDFSKERFSGMQTETPHLTNLFSSYDDIGFKQAGASYLYLRGSFSQKGLKSFPADELVFDEYDEFSNSSISLATRRMGASKLKRQLRLSTPTFPGVGIHALYMQSDQQIWEVKCARCSTFAELDFFRDVRANGAEWDEWRDWRPEQLRQARMSVECSSCHKKLDPCGPGRWVAQAPEITGIRGYQIPPLSFPAVNLNALAVAAASDDPTDVAEFFRSDLGVPYEAAGSRITEEMLKGLSHALDGGRLPDVAWTDTTLGADIGKRLHFRIASTGPDGRRYVRKMGACTWADLDIFMEQFKVRRAVIDALPEYSKAEEWVAKWKGRALRAFYPKAENMNKQLFNVDDPTGTVKIHRTMAMDKVYTMVATAQENWPAAIHNDREVMDHMKAPIRIETADAHGQPQADWVHTSPDHLYHACVYDLIAYLTMPVNSLVVAAPVGVGQQNRFAGAG